MRRQRFSKGFSMLEILVALVISLILLAGVLHIFLSGRNSYNLQAGFTQLQENGRFIDEYINRIIRLAGYRSIPPQGNTFVEMTTVFSASTPFITGTQGTGINSSDSLIIRYQGSGDGLGNPDGTIRDCLNNAADANTLVTNTFSLNNNNELQCQAQNANASPADQTQTLVSGVENMQILYGEDTDQDGIANRYVPSNYAFLNFANIVSLRISLVLRSTQQINTVPFNTTYYMLGTTYTPPNDNYLRAQTTFTILLRNLLKNPE